MAIISARIGWLTEERETLDVPVERVDGTIGGDHGAAAGHQREANDIAAAEDDLRLRVRSEPDDAATAAERSRDVKIAEAIEGEALRASEAAEENTYIAARSDFVDAVEAGRRRAGDIQIARGTEGEMIRGKRRLERGEDENFAVGTDFENRAAAIAYVEAAGSVEGESGGDAHAFDPLHGAAVGRDAVNGAIVAARNEKVAVVVDGEAGGVHQLGDERLHGVVRGDFIERDGNLLAALAAEGDVDVSFGVDGGAGDWVQVVGNLHAERHREGRAFDAAHFHADCAAFGAIGDAGDKYIFGGHHEAALCGAELNLRAGVVARVKAAAFDRDFTARQGCCGRDAFDSRCAVRFQFGWSRCCHVPLETQKLPVCPSRGQDKKTGAANSKKTCRSKNRRYRTQRRDKTKGRLLGLATSRLRRKRLRPSHLP